LLNGYIWVFQCEIRKRSEYAWREIGRFLRKQHLPLPYSIPLFLFLFLISQNSKYPSTEKSITTFTSFSFINTIRASALLPIHSQVLSLSFPLTHTHTHYCKLLFSSFWFLVEAESWFNCCSSLIQGKLDIVIRPVILLFFFRNDDEKRCRVIGQVMLLLRWDSRWNAVFRS